MKFLCNFKFYRFPRKVTTGPRREKITVRSPVLMMIPLQVPSTALVEKNARFRVSKGFSLVHSADRDCGSDSPVNDELST